MVLMCNFKFLIERINHFKLFKMETYSIPNWFSEIATNAFIHALQFAKIMQADIVHSYNWPLTNIFSWKLLYDLRFGWIVTVWYV
jgi:hypothetical protein